MKLKNIPRQAVILGLVSLFTDVASEMLYPVMPIYLNAVLGASMSLIGVIEGAAEITAGLLKGYFGSLSDKLMRRRIFVLLGYGISALAKPLPGIFINVPATITARIADRIGKGVRTAPRDALLGASANGASGAVFGFHRGMDTLGAAIGPVIALIILALTSNNYPLIFLVAFIPSVIAVGFIFFVKETPAAAKNNAKFSYKDFWRSAPKDYKQLIILFTVFSFANSSDVFLILKSGNVSHSNQNAIAGYILYNIVYAFSSYPLGRLSDKLSKRLIMSAGFIVFSFVYLGFAFADNIALIWALFALYGVYAAATEGISKAWISDLIPDERRGTAIGLHTMLASFAVMLGSSFAGAMWDMFGPQIPFLISSALSLCVAITLRFQKSE